MVVVVVVAVGMEMASSLMSKLASSSIVGVLGGGKRKADGLLRKGSGIVGVFVFMLPGERVRSEHIGERGTDRLGD